MAGPYALLWLEGPLQSWGSDSKFNRRESLPFPTKSGILGMVCCAMGAGGEQVELLARFAPLSQSVVAYGRLQPNRPEVLLEPEPSLMDFHMVGSGYDDANPWQKLMIPKTPEGKPAVGGGTKMTYRVYLQDRRFAVLLELPPDLAQEIAQAFANPVWPIYLGRKNCPPTELVFQGLHPSLDEGFLAAANLAQEKSLYETFRVLDGEVPYATAMTLTDVPLRFGPQKLYRDRRVSLVPS